MEKLKSWLTIPYIPRNMKKSTKYAGTIEVHLPWKINQNYEINKPLLACWYIGGKCPQLKDCRQNFIFALKALLLCQLLIFFTILWPWALSSDIIVWHRKRELFYYVYIILSNSCFSPGGGEAINRRRTISRKAQKTKVSLIQ